MSDDSGSDSSGDSSSDEDSGDEAEGRVVPPPTLGSSGVDDLSTPTEDSVREMKLDVLITPEASVRMFLSAPRAHVTLSALFVCVFDYQIVKGCV
jgi:hypothetical protein